MFNKPNRRAFCQGSSPRAALTLRAMRFHAKGELSTQNSSAVLPCSNLNGAPESSANRILCQSVRHGE